MEIIVFVALIVMIALGVWATNYGFDRDDTFATALGILSVIGGVVIVAILTTNTFKIPSHKGDTIRVDNIERIDTLYRGRDVIGYEIVIKEK